MADAMEFPETFDEFVESYGFVDYEKIYTNGSQLIPVFRVKQWLEHISSVENKGKWEKIWRTDCECSEYVCSKCGCGEDFLTDFCPNCGADMRKPKADDLSTMFENVDSLSKSDKEKMKSWEIEPKGEKGGE